MKIENAHFRPLEYWSQNKCRTVDDVLDFARCLEDIAFKVLRNWHIFGDSQELTKPDLETMIKFKEYDLTVSNSDLEYKSGWIETELQMPYLAQFVSNEELGNWGFEFNGWYDPDVYCDDDLVAPYVFMRDMYTLKSYNQALPHIYLRIPAPQNNILGNIMARCHFTGLNEYNDLIRDIAHSLRTSCQLLSTINRRDNLYVSGEIDIHNSKLIDKEREVLTNALLEVANCVDFNALLEKNIDTFKGSLQKSQKALLPLSEYAKKFTIYLIGHSHIDLAWRWRWPETIECMKGTIETQLELMDRDDEYVYVETSAAIWEALKEKYPEFWEKCNEKAKKGQFEPQGGMWCEPDGMCLSGESWVRQLLYGQKTSEECCDKISTCGVNIDGFGFNGGLPKIYKEAGIENFVTQKLRYNEFTVFPYIHFWWESDDGSRILALHAYPSHSNHIDIDELSQTVRIHHNTDGMYHIPIMWGYGNHGGGPQHIMMNRVDYLKKVTVFPNICYSGFSEYFDIIREKEKETIENFPIIKDELFLETHHKTYTAQGKMKKMERTCARELTNTEALLSVATYFGEIKNNNLLDETWKTQLFNQFHDILTGTSFPCVYQDVTESYDKAFLKLNQIKNDNQKQLFGIGNKKYVFNPLAWQRDCTIMIDADDFYETGVIEDSRGNQMNYQKTQDDKIVFVAKDLPALGFETYKQVKNAKVDCNLKSGVNWVTNKHMDIRFDSEKGIVSSMKIEGKEIVADGIGELKFLEDTEFRDYETWNMGLTGKEFSPNCVSFEKIEDGPVRVVFRAKYEFGLGEKKRDYYGIILWHTPAVDYPTSFFTQDFIIYDNSKKVECVLNTDWWEDKMVLKVQAKTNLENTKAFYEIPFGAISRPTKRETTWEKARYEVPANSWADITDDKLGFAILNRSRHGYDALGGRLRLTLLTSPYGANKSLVSDPLADRGRHIIEYAFYPHIGDYKQAQLHREAFEYENPAIVLEGDKPEKVQLGIDFVCVDPSKFIVTTVKPAQENGNIVVRGFEPYGNSVEFEFDGILKDRTGFCCDFYEKEKKSYDTIVEPHKIKSFIFE